MKRFLPQFAAAIVAVFTAANADVIPDFPKGYRAAHNEVVFEGLESFPDMAFVLYPAYHSPAPRASVGAWLEPGKAPRFYGLMGPKLYAVKRGTNRAFDAAFFPKPGSPPPRDFPVLDEALAAQLLTMPRSEKGFSKGYIKVADSSPTKSIQSVYRVTGIANYRIALEKSERRLDASGKVISGGSGGPGSLLKSLFGAGGRTSKADSEPQSSWERTPIALATGTLAALSVVGLIRAKRKQASTK